MRLQESRSANAVSYYITEGYRNGKGVSTSRIIEKLGTAKQIKEKYGEDIDPKQWCLQRLAELEEAKKSKKPVYIDVRLQANQPYEKYAKRSFNVGYLFLQKILHNLGFSKMIKDIYSRHKYQYDFAGILSNLIYSRVMEPCSKRSSYDFCKKYLLEEPNYELHDVYRALDVIEEESDFIQSFVYNHNDKIDIKNSDVMFYDCTNFYFEIAQEDNFRKYGHSKEGRYNPLVQLGMFIDGNGLPLAFSVFDGSSSEQLSLIPLEEKILKDFNLKGHNLYVCTDSGLCSFNNKFFNSKTEEGKIGDINLNYITVHPIRKMSKIEQEWVLNRGRSLKKKPIAPGENAEMVLSDVERTGWKVEGSNEIFSLDDIDEKDPKNFEKIFYKERYMKRLDKETKLEIDDRVIVTYSLKYKEFKKRKREKYLKAAEKIIKQKNQKKVELEGTSKKLQKFVNIENETKDGQKAEISKYSMNQEAIEEDERFDGFYAVSTSISSKLQVADIIRINKGRWQIEESFMLMKSEFRSRPVYVRKEPHIKAHFATCFLALLVFRILENEVNKRSKTVITAHEILKTLRNFQINTLTQGSYAGGFQRTDITDILHDMSPVRFDCEYISASNVRKAIKNSKKK